MISYTFNIMITLFSILFNYSCHSARAIQFHMQTIVNDCDVRAGDHIQQHENGEMKRKNQNKKSLFSHINNIE